MIYLKPQWALREHADGHWTLTSENSHQPIRSDYVPVLQRLAAGVDPATLDDEQFDQTVYLNEQGFVCNDKSADAPAWELCGAHWHSVQEQLKHNTFAVYDTTSNGVGSTLRTTLIAAGMQECLDTPRLTIAVGSSFQTLPAHSGNVLPVICNRMRITVGPMVFPWSPSISETVLASERYMPEPAYTLPPAFDALQRAWIGVAVLQFVGMNKLRYVDNFVEYNMGSQEHKVWPSK